MSVRTAVVFVAVAGLVLWQNASADDAGTVIDALKDATVIKEWQSKTMRIGRVESVGSGDIKPFEGGLFRDSACLVRGDQKNISGPYFTGGVKSGGDYCFRLPMPAGMPIGIGDAVRLNLRPMYEFSVKGKRPLHAPIRFTVALVQPGGYAKPDRWYEEDFRSTDTHRLYVEKERLAFSAPKCDPKWVSLADAHWKTDAANEIVFVFKPQVIEFWLNGQRTASTPLDESFRQLEWVHIRAPNMEWGVTHATYFRTTTKKD